MEKKGLKRFFSIVLCIAAFLIILPTIFSTNLRTSTSKGGVEQLIDKVITTDVTADNGEVKTTITAQLTDIIHEQIISNYPELDEVSKEQISDYIHKSTFKSFFAEKCSSIVNDLYKGEATTEITEEDIVSLIDDNKWILEENNIEFPEEFTNEVVTYISKSEIVETINKQILQTTIVENKAWKTVKNVTSILTIVISFVVALLLFAGIFFINIKRPQSTLLYAGWTILITGIVYLIIWSAVRFLPTVLNIAAGSMQYIFVVVNHILNTGMIISIIFVVLAVAMFVVYGVLKKKTKTNP